MKVLPGGSWTRGVQRSQRCKGRWAHKVHLSLDLDLDQIFPSLDLGLILSSLDPDLLVTRRGTLLMETGLLHDYFGNFSTRGDRYYFHMR